MILTYKYRLKDRHAAKHLRRMAVAVNQVWNYCNAYQRDVEARHQAGARRRRWPTHFDLTHLTAGVSKELGISSNTIGAVCKQYVKSRKEVRHSTRFRASIGPRRALGWVPLRQGQRGYKIDGNSIIYLGQQFRWFGNKGRPCPTTTKGGAFVEDSLGRWWVALQVEVPDVRASESAYVGIDLGLKALATLSTGVKVESLPAYRRHEAARCCLSLAPECLLFPLVS